MIVLKDTKDLQKDIHEVTENLVKLRDKSIEAEIETLFIDMEKLFNVIKQT